MACFAAGPLSVEAWLAAMDESALHDCIDKIYEAALDPALWPLLLDALGRGLRSEVSAIFLQDQRSAEVGFLECVGQDAATMAAYRDHYSKVNVWLESAARLPAGTPVHTPELLDAVSFERSEFYGDWLRPQGVYYSLGCTVLRHPAAETHVTLLRSPTTGPYTREEQAAFARLTAHVRRAVDIHRRLHTATLMRDGMLARLERMALGVAVVDRDGRLLFANATAEGILGLGSGLTVRAGRLTAVDGENAAIIARAIAEAAASSAPEHAADAGVILLRRPSSRPLSILVCRLSPGGVAGIAEPSALVFIHAEDRDARVRDADLMALYGLTRAEARLMRSLLQGQRLSEYAARAGISVNTAKSYLRDVFGKTGASRQSDLFRRVLTNPLLQMSSD
jgi:DNA-binding CsgD family transcriptional regulator/PAS domain-containing protein